MPMFSNPLGLSDQQLALLASGGKFSNMFDSQLDLAPETERPGLFAAGGLFGQKSSNEGSGTTVVGRGQTVDDMGQVVNKSPESPLSGGPAAPGGSSFLERFISQAPPNSLGSAIGAGLFGAEQFNQAKASRKRGIQAEELSLERARLQNQALRTPTVKPVKDAAGFLRDPQTGERTFPDVTKERAPPSIVQLQQARDAARSEGRFHDADQITGQIDAFAASETFDLRNRLPVGDQPAETSSNRFASLIDPGGATGLEGALKGLANKISDGFGFGLAFKDANKATVALESLRNGTLLALTATGIEGRPSVFSSEKVDNLTIKPGEIFAGPEAAAAKAQRLFTDIDTEIKRMDRDILGNPRSFTQQAISKARANRSQLVGLRDAYSEIIKKFDSGPGGDADLNQFFRKK